MVVNKNANSILQMPEKRCHISVQFEGGRKKLKLFLNVTVNGNNEETDNNSEDEEVEEENTSSSSDSSESSSSEDSSDEQEVSKLSHISQISVGFLQTKHPGTQYTSAGRLQDVHAPSLKRSEYGKI